MLTPAGVTRDEELQLNNQEETVWADPRPWEGERIPSQMTQ